MSPKFGTSGLRGLVTELTPGLVGAHVAAFARACPTGAGLWLGRDLRPSSPAIAQAVAAAARAAGLAVTDCGEVPTPALAMAAMRAGAAAVMVTGSHIPADRNGLKFYTPAGEITKADEAAITAALGAPEVGAPEVGAPAARALAAGAAAGAPPQAGAHVAAAYVARYRDAFGTQALAGRRIAVFSHSAVGRDLLRETLSALGAAAVEVGRSEVFVPVDTEAVDAPTRAALRRWAAETGAEAIVSTDGDGDRPLVADAAGRVVPGDVLGQITARVLGAGVVVTPVSSNTGAEASGAFARVVRTRIGSPFVIAAMEAALAETPGARVAGYEANGGFLLGFEAAGPAGPLPALMTRDALLPILAPLVAAGTAGLAALVAAEPRRFTAADRLQEVDTARAAALIAALAADDAARAGLLAELACGGAVALDRTDGLRMTLDDGRILHLRPSGNAPELRVYAEAGTEAAAAALVGGGLAAVARLLG